MIPKMTSENPTYELQWIRLKKFEEISGFTVSAIRQMSQRGFIPPDVCKVVKPHPASRGYTVVHYERFNRWLDKR